MTILVAGIFAFSPIEQASTVHNIIVNNVQTQVITAGPFTVDAENDDGDICINLAAGDGEMKIFSAFINTTDMEGTAEIQIDSIELDGADCDATPSITNDTFDINSITVVNADAAPFADNEIFQQIQAVGNIASLPTVTDNVIFRVDVILGNDGDNYTYIVDFIVETSDGVTPTILEDLP